MECESNRSIGPRPRAGCNQKTTRLSANRSAVGIIAPAERRASTMPKRILIVEDERKSAAYLERGLVENDFAVEVCRDGDDGLAKALAGGFDLIILDVMLPQRDGWSILAELRRAGDRTPVLFLT